MWIIRKSYCFNKQFFTLQVARFASAALSSPVKLAAAVYENPSSSPKGPPLVILHGLFGSKQNWNSMCKAYVQKTDPPRTIISLDLRNHGESPHNTEHSYDHLSEDVKHYLDDNGIDKVTIMGHSMGGRCAMFFAFKYPQVLEKLVVVDISPITVSPKIDQMSDILQIMKKVEMPTNMPLSEARNIVGQQLAEVIQEPDIRAFILTNLVPTEPNTYKWRANVSVLIEKFVEMVQFRFPTDPQYDGDVLFIGGSKSDFIPTDLAQNHIYKPNLAYASYQSTDEILGTLPAKETPLVLIHGLLGSKANFNTVSIRYHLNATPKRLVYSVDLRNHGDSGQADGMSYDEIVIDVVNFLKSFDLKTVSLIGHDIGGRVGMLIALKFPELVEKLIVVDMSPITTSHNFNVFPQILKILFTLYFPSELSYQQAKAFAASNLSRVIRNKGLMNLVMMNLTQNFDGSYCWRFNTRALLMHFNELALFPQVHNLQFERPVLFLGGGKSDYIQKSDFPHILKLFPKAELKYIEGAGHWVHAEKPTEFLKITTEFLNKPST